MNVVTKGQTYLSDGDAVQIAENNVQSDIENTVADDETNSEQIKKENPIDSDSEKEE